MTFARGAPVEGGARAQGYPDKRTVQHVLLVNGVKLLEPFSHQSVCCVMLAHGVVRQLSVRMTLAPVVYLESGAVSMGPQQEQFVRTARVAGGVTSKEQKTKRLATAVTMA